MSPHQKMKEQGEKQAKKWKTVRRHREREKKERSRLRDPTSGPGNFQEEASENSGDEQHPEDSVSGDQTEEEWCGGVFVDHRFESWMEERRILDLSESGDEGQRDAETTNHGTNLIPQPHFDLTEEFTEDEDEMRKATSTSPGAEEDEGFDEM